MGMLSDSSTTDDLLTRGATIVTQNAHHGNVRREARRGNVLVVDGSVSFHEGNKIILDHRVFIVT